jgi:uncharacterized RDD family membrane protein YckC
LSTTPPPPPPPENPYGMPPIAEPADASNLAQWPMRAGGYVIDLLLLLPGYLLLFIGMPKTTADAQTGLMTVSTPGVTYYLGILVILGITIWNRWLKGGSTGQTIGRGVVGVKLVSEETGQPIGALMAFVRDIAHIVDSVICYVGWLFPLWDAKRQTIADKIMKTVVVNVPK